MVGGTKFECPMSNNRTVEVKKSTINCQLSTKMSKMKVVNKSVRKIDTLALSRRKHFNGGITPLMLFL